MVLRVFASGQSNMMGRGTGGPSWSSIDPRVRVWNNTNPLGANGSNFVSAETARSSWGTFENLDRGNLAVWFAHHAASMLSDAIDLTMVARGGTAIEAWRPGGSQPMLQECIDVWAATGQDAANVFLWHQGEGNTGTPNADYMASFNGLLADLTAAQVINENTLVILGGTAEESASRINFNDRSLKPLTAQSSRIFYASPIGLPTYDTTHFTGDALAAFGRRYADVYQFAAHVSVADTYTKVNVGGVPGEAMSGRMGLLNLRPFREFGVDRKPVNMPSELGTGNAPRDPLLSAAMIAAGAIVEIATGSNGVLVRFEGGLQVCWKPDVVLSRQNSETLAYTWTYPKRFITAPAITFTPDDRASVSMPVAKRAASLCEMAGNSNLDSSQVLQMIAAPGTYSAGNETCGGRAIAIGLWK